jgi:hypothetical protein
MTGLNVSDFAMVLHPRGLESVRKRVADRNGNKWYRLQTAPSDQRGAAIEVFETLTGGELEELMNHPQIQVSTLLVFCRHLLRKRNISKTRFLGSRLVSAINDGRVALTASRHRRLG